MTEDKTPKKGENPFSARNAAITAIGAATMYVSQVAMSFLPNIELVSLMVLLYTRSFGKKTLVMVYLFALIEGLTFGFGIWWINYLYVWTVMYFIAALTKNIDGAFIFACINGLYGLFFGALCSIPYFFVLGIGGGISYFVGGITFDFLHCAGNFALALVLFTPLDRILKKIAAGHIS